jgi:hypothetical protein
MSRYIDTENPLNNLIAPIAVLLIVLGAFPLFCTPPMGRVASWLRHRVGTADEPTVIATRAALQRMGFLGGTLLMVLAVALMISDLDYYLALVGYAVAVIVGATARMGGGARRRAGLMAGGYSSSSTGVFGTALILGTFTVTMSVAAFFYLDALTADGRGMPTLPADFWLADIDDRQLTVIACASAVITVLSYVGWALVARRQSIAGAAPEVDQLVRALCSRRIAYGALGGQAVLFGALMPAVQLFTLEVSAFSTSVDEGVVAAASAIGLAVIVAGIAASAWSVLSPVWIQPRHRTVAADIPGGIAARPAGAGSNASVRERN